MHRLTIVGASLVALWGSAAGAAGPCEAANGMTYQVTEIFSTHHACYNASGTCPPAGGVCANLALFKLGNYYSEDYEDLLFTPHRGVWGSTFGTTDPDFSNADPPAQNTVSAVQLGASFATKYTVNKEGKDYKRVLQGVGQEIDVTTYGNTVYGDDQAYAIMNHYMTTDDTITGTLYEYLMDMGDVGEQYVERRDFSMSPSTLTSAKLGKVSSDIVSNGVVAFLDIKAIRGKIPCQTENLQPGTQAYKENDCEYNEKPKSTQIDLLTQKIAARTIYDKGGMGNVVIKTPATVREVGAAFGNEMYEYMWQPHIGQNMGPEKAVQYIHDWLKHAPKAVLAWEMNIYQPGDQTTDTPFCVTAYIPPGQAPDEYPDGQVKVKVNPTQADSCMAEAGGILVNLLDYLRVNTGNPDYFGFSAEEKAERLYSGNRANLWLMETIAPAGTADRYYRWQMLGSDETYSLADPVKTLHYPYATYAILTGDRMESVRQILEKGLYPKKWGGPNDEVRQGN